MNENPLGSAALAGTSFPINRDMTTAELGFDRPTANSLDAVSDRDFVIEALADASICAMHLSRFAEELVIWSSAQFRFVQLSDKFSTGSSIMPQKRNPDAAELVRGKIGRINGALVSILTVMKGLPLAYSKDMQEDKEVAFDALDSLSLCLAAMTGMVGDLTVNRDAMREAAGSGYSTATDIADWLVREANVPFREAHHITGLVVALAEKKGTTLDGLTIEDLKPIDERIDARIFNVLSVEKSVASRTSYGGTAPKNVKAQVKKWTSSLGSEGEYSAKRDWGHFISLNASSDTRARHVFIKPGRQISLQVHQQRHESITIVRGEAEVTLGDRQHRLELGGICEIEPRIEHRIRNVGKGVLEFLEVQTSTGDYSTKDITHLEDFPIYDK